MFLDHFPGAVEPQLRGALRALTENCAFKTLAVVDEYGLFARLSGTEGTTALELAWSLGTVRNHGSMFKALFCAAI
jgi:hypothetical protein